MRVARSLRPSLEPGDHLTRAEFHKRYCQRPDIRRAELIGGVVYMPSPMRYELHDEPTGNIAGWLAAYRARHPGVRQGNGGTIYMNDDVDEVQPDAFLFYDPPRRPEGITHTEDGYLRGAPEFVFEIAASSASYDLHAKRAIYQQAGVLEYAVWRTLDGMIDWFRLLDGAYQRIDPDEDGVIVSTVFPGLALPIPALLRGDLPALLAALEPPVVG